MTGHIGFKMHPCPLGHFDRCGIGRKLFIITGDTPLLSRPDQDLGRTVNSGPGARDIEISRDVVVAGWVVKAVADGDGVVRLFALPKIVAFESNTAARR